MSEIVDKILSLAPPAVKEFLDSIVPKLIAHIVFIWAIIGIVFLSKTIYILINVIYARFLRPSKNLKSYGTWAIVTGSTDGIGEALAIELAKKGLNLILISRSLDKLQATSLKITTKYPKIQVKTIDIDYSKYDINSHNKIENIIKDLDIGILINNVGISYQYPKYFHELDDERVEQLITVNVNSTTEMTRLVLPSMVKKRKGSIVNISSFAG